MKECQCNRFQSLLLSHHFFISMNLFIAGILFPLFSITYIIAPHSKVGLTMRKPFIKFICHSASYFTFLCKYIRIEDTSHDTYLLLSTYPPPLPALLRFFLLSHPHHLSSVFPYLFQRPISSHSSLPLTSLLPSPPVTQKTSNIEQEENTHKNAQREAKHKRN